MNGWARGFMLGCSFGSGDQTRSAGRRLFRGPWGKGGDVALAGRGAMEARIVSLAHHPCRVLALLTVLFTSLELPNRRFDLALERERRRCAKLCDPSSESLHNSIRSAVA
jgi:hypothetical protein